MCLRGKRIALDQVDDRVLGPAEPSRVRRDRVEHRGDVGRRARDRTEHLGDRRLALEPFFRLVEETRILHRDRGLACERLDDAGVRLGEPSWLRTAHEKDPFDVVRDHEGNTEDGPRDAGGVLQIELGVGPDVLDLNGPPLEEHASDHAVTPGRELPARPERPQPRDLLGRSGDRGDLAHATIDPDDRAGVGISQAHRALRDRREHTIEIERGAADRPEDLRDGGLLVQRLLRRVEEPNVLDRDRGLVGEGPSEVDLLLGEGAQLESAEADRAKRSAFPHEGHGEERADAHLLSDRIHARWLGLHVRDVDDPQLSDCPSTH